MKAKGMHCPWLCCIWVTAMVPEGRQGNRVSAEESRKASLIATIKRLNAKREKLQFEVASLEAARAALTREVRQLREETRNGR